ncbi:hypothetical protein FisN_14Hh163 [Fistulifera solaris]|uniref:Glutathione S-transferase n=1 Tax=Fistulifera solaris TaxID=1519565 RepID=A0A1Z5K8F4_FISSO|nr:hypothetical protein FisN_14Hh163 [Fistulifera solaris]|eukprot:GAX22540.1 hypothetical protein FisN_14Hh163 [Fistulifera solaris]
MTVPKLTLTYFDIEGRGEPIRLCLALAGIPFEDERVAFSDWKEMKPKAPFGQLPYLKVDKEDGSEPVFRTQSLGILRGLAREYAPDLYLDVFAVEEAMGIVDDMMDRFIPSMYISMRPAQYGHPADVAQTEEGKKTIKAMRERFVNQDLPVYLKQLETLLARHDNKFLASTDKPSIADCYAVPSLRSFTRNYLDHIPGNCLDDHPLIVDYIKRFCALPEIQGRYTTGLY